MRTSFLIKIIFRGTIVSDIEGFHSLMLSLQTCFLTSIKHLFTTKCSKITKSIRKYYYFVLIDIMKEIAESSCQFQYYFPLFAKLDT